MSHEQFEAPVNPVPGVVLALVAVMALVEGVFALGAQGVVGGAEAIGWRLEALERFSFRSQIFDWMLINNRYPPEHISRLITYPFVHLSFTHMLFAAVLTLALGKMVGEVLGAKALFILWITGAVVGALAFWIIVPAGRPLAGGYPPVYALIGGYTFILWVGLTRLGQASYRAFMLIGLLIGLQLFFALLYGFSGDLVADVAAFIAGFFLSFLVSPGGWTAFLARVRQR